MYAFATALILRTNTKSGNAFITSGLPHFDVNFVWDAAGYFRIALC